MKYLASESITPFAKWGTREQLNVEGGLMYFRRESCALGIIKWLSVGNSNFCAGPSGVKVEPLLEEPVPESYLVLQDFVRETAQAYVQSKKKPILTKKEYM